jgi:hypothetical protein
MDSMMASTVRRRQRRVKEGEKVKRGNGEMGRRDNGERRRKEQPSSLLRYPFSVILSYSLFLPFSSFGTTQIWGCN